MTTEQSVFVVDDEPAIRELVAKLANSLGYNCEALDSAETFLERCDHTTAGCLVLDLWLPGMSGLELLDVMRRDRIRLPTVVVSAYVDIPMAVRAMQSGAVTLLEKPYRMQELWDAVHQALVLDTQIHHNEARVVDVQKQLASLTKCEHNVLELILAGKTNRNISQSLSVPLRTVESRRHGLMVKVKVDSLAALVRIVTEARLMLSAPFAGAGLTSGFCPSAQNAPAPNGAESYVCRVHDPATGD